MVSRKLLECSWRARHRLFTVALILVALGAMAGCTEKLKLYKIKNLSFPHQAKVLDNGMKVVLQQDPRQSKVLITLRLQVGSAHDPAEAKGVAHVTEHLAFRINEKLVAPDDEVSSEPDAPASSTESSTSAEKGEREKKKSKAKKHVRVINFLLQDDAWTNNDETFYYRYVVAHDLPASLNHFSGILRDFSKDISEDVFETEMGVVRSERRSRYFGQPHDEWVLNHSKHFFPEGHPYRVAPIGTKKTLAAIDLEQVGAFLREHYHAANATLTIIGPIDYEEVSALVDEKFAPLPKRSPSELVRLDDRETGYREKVIEIDGTDEALVSVAWPLGSSTSREVRAAYLASSSHGGVFRNDLVGDVAHWVSSGVWHGDYESRFVVTALLKDPADVERARDQIFESMQSMVNLKWLHWFARARRRQVYSSIYQLESPLDRAWSMTANFARNGEPMSWVSDHDEIYSIKRKESRNLLREKLVKERAFVLIQVPKDEGKSAARSVGRKGQKKTIKVSSTKGKSNSKEERDLPDSVYDFEQPFEDYASWARQGNAIMEEGKTIELDNGIRCHIVQQPGLPILAVSARFGGGRLAESASKAGAADLSLRSRSWSNSTDSTNVWRIGMRTDRSNFLGSVRLTYKALSMYADEALGLVVEHLFDPSFENDDIDGRKKSLIREVRENHKDLNTLAYRALRKMVGVAKALPETTIAGVEDLGRGDAVDYHDEHFYPENLYLSIVSDRSHAEVEALLRKHFGEIDAADKPAVNIAELESFGIEQVPNQLALIDVDKKTQSKVLWMTQAPGYHDWKKRLRAELVRTIVQERVKKLREAMGVTYGISTSLFDWGRQSNLVVSTKVKRKKTVDAVEQLMKTIDKLSEHDITKGELERAVRGRLWDFSSSDRSSERLANRHTYAMSIDRPSDYDSRRIDYLISLRPEDLTESLRGLLAAPSGLIIAGGITDEVRALGASLDKEVIDFSAESLMRAQ